MQLKASKLAILVGLTCLSLLAASSPAQAALVLKLSDGITTETVADLDSDGSVAFIGAIGNFGFNVTVGASKPLLGDADTAHLTLVFSNFLTSGGGTLTIELTDTDYTVLGAGSLDWGFVGTTSTGSSVTLQGWKDLDNAEFGIGTLTTGLLGAFSGAFSGSGSTAHGLILDPYSMTIRFVYTASAPDQDLIASFNLQNNNIVPVPEPALTALFGIGLTFLGFAVRRRRKSIS